MKVKVMFLTHSCVSNAMRVFFDKIGIVPIFSNQYILPFVDDEGEGEKNQGYSHKIKHPPPHQSVSGLRTIESTNLNGLI